MTEETLLASIMVRAYGPERPEGRTERMPGMSGTVRIRAAAGLHGERGGQDNAGQSGTFHPCSRDGPVIQRHQRETLAGTMVPDKR